VLSHAEARPAAAPPPPPRIAFPSPPPLVSLIIPTRDRAALLRLSVGSIRAKTTYPNYEIIVVDNGSREAETLALFDAWAADPVIRVLRDDRPFNYAALNNAAATKARGDLLGLVNNDVEVLEATWLEAMVSLALKPGVGCVGAKLLYPDGTLQHGGVVTGIAGVAGHRNKRARPTMRGRLDDLVSVNEVSAVTAACLLVRGSIYRAVGGLDEGAFAVAYNDVDFCLKVLAAGYRNLWTPFAVLNHHESVSRGHDLSPAAAERFNRENLELRLRWGARLLEDPYYSANLTVDAENGAIRTQ
jgi:GT2 family glycosyltransferase